MNSDNFCFLSPESVDSNLNLQSHNFSFANYPFPSPLPLGGYEAFVTGENNSTFGGNQIRYNFLDKETSCLGGTGTKSADKKNKRSQIKCKTTFGNRSSIYRGVTRHENGRCEAFVWDNTDPQEKAKTTYVGGFEHEENAARAHDQAALKLWGESAALNFPLSEYEKDLEEMKSYSKKDYFLHIRRNMTGFAKGISNYRGVSKNADNKKWQARLGKGRDIDSIYLGTFDTQEEAARAYDIAAIRVRGRRAITNFDISKYDVQHILDSTKFPIKGASKKLRRSSVEDVLQKRSKTRNIPFLELNVDSSGNPSLTSSAPPSFQPIIQTQTNAIDSNSDSQYPCPFLQYYINNPSCQIPDPWGYQNPKFQSNPTFNPRLNYGAGEEMEPTVQFQPIQPIEKNEFPFHQNYNTDSQHHLHQNPSSNLRQKTQNLNSHTNPNFLAGGNNLASDSYMREFPSSHGDDINEVSGNLVEKGFGVDNSDLDDPSSWLDMFLMNSDRSDSNV